MNNQDKREQFERDTLDKMSTVGVIRYLTEVNNVSNSYLTVVVLRHLRRQDALLRRIWGTMAKYHKNDVKEY